MTESSVVILGGGGHARVLISELLLLDRKVVGVLDPNLDVDQTISGVKVVGGDDKLSLYNPSEVQVVNGIGRLPKDCGRSRLLKKGVGASFDYAKVLSRNAIIHEAVEIGEGVQVLSGAVVQTGVTLGPHAVINTNSSVDHDCRVGPNVWISPGVTICGDVRIGENSYISAGVTILQGVSLKPQTVIPAGSVVKPNS